MMSGEHVCHQEGNIANISNNVSELDKSVTDLVSEIKNMTKTLVEHMIENRESAVKIEALVKNQDFLFDRLRRIEDDKCPEIEKETEGNRIRSETNADSLKDLKFSLGKRDEDIEKRLKSLEKWRNRISGGLIVASLIWGLLAAYISKVLAKGITP